MAGTNSNYSIIADVELDLKSIEKQLKSQRYKIDYDTSSVKKGADDFNAATQAARGLNDAGQDLELTFNVANEIFSKTTEVIKSMVDQVYELDSALTEYKKVSSLTGSELDDYTNKLSKLGQEVGRTGKPNRSEPVCCDGKAA